MRCLHPLPTGREVGLETGTGTRTDKLPLTSRHHCKTTHQHSGCAAHVGSRFLTQTPIVRKLILVPFPGVPASARVKQNPFSLKIFNYLNTKQSLSSSVLGISLFHSLKENLKYFKLNKITSIHIEMVILSQ